MMEMAPAPALAPVDMMEPMEMLEIQMIDNQHGI
jgi:hypothetical protein